VRKAASKGTRSRSPKPRRNYLGQSSGVTLYAAASNLTAMAQNAIGNVGGSQAHTNMQPFLVLNFCIALQGIFPSQN
jgi:microcystin-dependent protein